MHLILSQSPQTGQFNSYPEFGAMTNGGIWFWSQSPQTGQFNSYPASNHKESRLPPPTVSIPSNGSIQFLHCCEVYGRFTNWSLNPLKRVNSILTKAKIEKTESGVYSLNPLKRVNSILTGIIWFPFKFKIRVSIPSNGSIQFLH